MPNPNPKAAKYSRNDHVMLMKFDNNYYKNVMKMKGLLKLDNVLYLDPRTKAYVEKMAQYFYELWIQKWMAVFVKAWALKRNLKLLPMFPSVGP